VITHNLDEGLMRERSWKENLVTNKDRQVLFPFVRVEYVSQPASVFHIPARNWIEASLSG